VVGPLDLSAQVCEMLELVNVSIAKSARLRLELREDLPPIHADATQISQVIMNLITNASEAIGEAQGVIALRTGVTDVDRACLAEARVGADAAAGPYAYVEVRDTGCGMDERTAARIFDPFFTTKFTGRGLGLAAVLGIVRGHGGAIIVDSTPARGTTIRVLFPVSGEPEPVAAEESPAGRHINGRGTVLVVDDEEVVRAVATEALLRDGFAVLIARDGREAQEVFQARAGDIDLVLLDLTMPRADGEEVLRGLQRVRDDVRVILSSGYAQEHVARRFAGAGLAGFIQKPYTSAALAAAVRGVLDTSLPATAG